MSKPADVVSWASARIGYPYIYGATGQTCTPSYRRARIDQYPEYKDNITTNCPVLSGKQSSCTGCKYDGKEAYDCAQFTRFAMKSVGITLVSGATSQWTKTSWETKGTIANMPRDKVCMVFRADSSTVMGHVGIYCGDSYVIHAKGHAYGVVKDALSSGNWTHYGIPTGLYADGEVEEDPDTPIPNDPTANLPSGLNYHPDGYYYGNVYLSEKYKQVNALYIAKVMREAGWTDNAIAGLLGNMDYESNINPGIWQSRKEGNLSGGYGLTQWTPASKYVNWVSENNLGDIWNMNNQLQRIKEEFAPGTNVHDQYYSTSEYPVNRTDFPTSTLAPDYLARAFVRNYERPYSILYGSESDKAYTYRVRGEAGTKWYEYITNNNAPDTPGGDTGESIKLSFDITIWLATRRTQIVVR